jgi:hypothetical protein
MTKKNDNQKTSLNNDSEMFDLSKLALPQDFSEFAGVKKILTTVPVKKPNRQDFIRVHEGEDWCLQTAVLELKEERETYLVDAKLRHELPGEILPKVLFPTINRQGVLFLWPVKLPDESGRHDNWNRSALEAAMLAKSNWIRVAANMSLGAYEIFQATGDLPDPTWPEVTFQEIVEIAFRDKFIRSMDHPVVKRLRGSI